MYAGGAGGGAPDSFLGHMSLRFSPATSKSFCIAADRGSQSKSPNGGTKWWREKSKSSVLTNSNTIAGGFAAQLLAFLAPDAVPVLV